MAADMQGSALVAACSNALKSVELTLAIAYEPWTGLQCNNLSAHLLIIQSCCTVFMMLAETDDEEAVISAAASGGFNVQQTSMHDEVTPPAAGIHSEELGSLSCLQGCWPLLRGLGKHEQMQ